MTASSLSFLPPIKPLTVFKGSASPAASAKKGYSPSSSVKDVLQANKINPLSAQETKSVSKRALVHVGNGTSKGCTLRITPRSNHLVELSKSGVNIKSNGQDLGTVSISQIQRILSDEELKRIWPRFRRKVSPEMKAAVKAMFEDCSEEFAARRGAISELKEADKRYQKALARKEFSQELSEQFIGLFKKTTGADRSKREKKKREQVAPIFDRLKQAIDTFESHLTVTNKDTKKE